MKFIKGRLEEIEPLVQWRPRFGQRCDRLLPLYELGCKLHDGVYLVFGQQFLLADVLHRPRTGKEAAKWKGGGLATQAPQKGPCSFVATERANSPVFRDLRT